MLRFSWFKKEDSPATPVIAQKRRDFYLQHTPGQPKRVIGDYVAKNGILVPKRFDSLRDAKKSRKKILARSEHWREYAGESGILESATLGGIGDVGFDEQRLKEAMLKMAAAGHEEFCKYAQYCKYLGTSIGQYKSEVSFSLWEMLEGYNLAIVADSAIGGKYHVFRKAYEKPNGEYLSIENGKITFRTKHIASELQKNIMNIPAFYEEVRNLPNFDPTHCPIIEAQIHKGKIYFLQYHRGRDFEPPDFELEGPAGKQKEAEFVRGATRKEGLVCNLIVEYCPDCKKNLPEKYDAYMSAADYNTVYTEMLMRRTNVWINIAHEASLDDEIGHMATHRGISQLFKPANSMVFGKRAMEIEKYALQQEKSRRKADLAIPILVISDGRKARLEWR